MKRHGMQSLRDAKMIEMYDFIIASSTLSQILFSVTGLSVYLILKLHKELIV